MREIDFIPDWYKHELRSEVIYRSQYFALAGILVIIVLCNSIASKSVSNVNAEITQVMSKYAQVQKNEQPYLNLQKQIEQLKKKSSLLAEVDSRINVSAVLAEISFLVSDRIVLSEVAFAAEEFEQDQPKKASGSIVKVASSQSGSANRMVGNVKFKVTINGMAADASEVAKLISDLENSPYFFQVVPLYSNIKRNSPDRITESYQLNEFQIHCYLRNYHDQKLGQNK